MERPIRRVWNPPNPYLSAQRLWLGEEPPPEAAVEVYEDRSRSILSRNDSPDLPFRWSVNPYRGCAHACIYCYARPTHEYLGLGAGTDFETKLVVKPEAPRLLREAFLRPSWRGEPVVFSGVTDCYQPLEAGWRLTRGCLEVCAEFRNPVAIVTKSALIQRDVDLLERLHREASVSVFLSIPFLDEQVARAVAPGAPAIHRRFETMKALARAGVPVGIGVSPIIPGLNDADIPGLLRGARECGATQAFRTLLRLPGSVREAFFHRMRERLPGQVERIEGRIRWTRQGHLSDSRFGHRHSGSGIYWETIEQMWEVWTRRLGFWQEREAETPNTFCRPVTAAMAPSRPRRSRARQQPQQTFDFAA
jgi:DNA repair photolyase